MRRLARRPPPPSRARPARQQRRADDVRRLDPGDGQLSLREAVAAANATTALDAIRFASPLEGDAPLVLTGGQLTVSDDLRIDGDRDHDGIGVTIDGNDASRILRITGGGTDVALIGLTLARGRAGDNESGGAI